MRRSTIRIGRAAVITIALALSTVALGCNPAVSRRARDGGVVGGDGGGTVLNCDASADADGDGIADGAELLGDFDADGQLNENDLDSDNDGIPDSVEHGGSSPCAPRDDDGDTFPNAYDLDSDNDGLTDADEIARGTDPTDVDSDGDGVSDFGEVSATGGNPLDGTDEGGVAPGDFFVVLPYNGDHQLRTLEFGTNLQQADVYFLIDTTGSMQTAIDDVNSSLMSIAATVRGLIPDVQFGVGRHDDFPDGGYGSSTGFFSGLPDVPYANLQDITDNLGAVNAALGLTVNDGSDTPESETAAIYMTASGASMTYSIDTGGSITIPERVCPDLLDMEGHGRGYPCFRPGSLPIVVLVSDAPWHNGVDSSNDYFGITGPVSFDMAVDAMNGIGARFIGANVGFGGSLADMNAMALATGSVSGTGEPLVFSGPASTTATQIINGIEALVGGTPQDVSTTTENVDGNPDDTDARFFIKAITPVEGFNGTLRGPMPGITYTSADSTMFYGVVPGTRVTFSVDFWNDFVHPPSMAQIYRARIIVIGNGVARLDTREVFIVVPPDGTSVVVI